MQKLAPFLGLFLPALAGCGDPSVFLPPSVDQGQPRGVIDGSVTYVGPAPCTKNGKILGAAVILAFDTRLLPPPEGLGSTAASLDVVPGEVFFSGIKSQLPFSTDGTTICGDPGAPVTVSGNWAVGPFTAGKYQIRGFYDLKGDFDPAFSISTLPSKGDIGGGAIENASAVLQGGRAKYREIQLGVPNASGDLEIPPEGVKVSGVAVTLGLPLPLERPIFHPIDVLDVNYGKNKDPNNVVMPADFQLKTFSANPKATEESFIRMVLGAGLSEAPMSAYSGQSEIQLSSASPFNLPNKNNILFYSRQDANGDGKISSADHVPDSTLIPALFPVAAFVKLTDGVRIGSQAAPTVLLQGLTIYRSLLETATAPVDLSTPSASVIVGLRPAVVCIDTMDPKKPGVLLTSNPTDSAGTALITDPDGVQKNLEGLFGRPFSLAYGCLPQGQYSINLVYGTGQAWTVPNEAGVCAPSEEAAHEGQTCGTRPRFSSQDVVLTIGPPDDPSYCAAHPTPDACLPAKSN